MGVEQTFHVSSRSLFKNLIFAIFQFLKSFHFKIVEYFLNSKTFNYEKTTSYSYILMFFFENYSFGIRYNQ